MVVEYSKIIGRHCDSICFQLLVFYEEKGQPKSTLNQLNQLMTILDLCNGNSERNFEFSLWNNCIVRVVKDSS